MNDWTRRDDAIYYEQKPFARIVQTATHFDEKAFDELIGDYEDATEDEEKDVAIEAFEALTKMLEEAPTIAQVHDALLTRMKEVAAKGGWNMITVKQLETFFDDLELPRFIQPNGLGFGNDE